MSLKHFKPSDIWHYVAGRNLEIHCASIIRAGGLLGQLGPECDVTVPIRNFGKYLLDEIYALLGCVCVERRVAIPHGRFERTIGSIFKSQGIIFDH